MYVRTLLKAKTVISQINKCDQMSHNWCEAINHLISSEDEISWKEFLLDRDEIKLIWVSWISSRLSEDISTESKTLTSFKMRRGIFSETRSRSRKGVIKVLSIYLLMACIEFDSYAHMDWTKSQHPKRNELPETWSVSSPRGPLTPDTPALITAMPWAPKPFSFKQAPFKQSKHAFEEQLQVSDVNGSLWFILIRGSFIFHAQHYNPICPGAARKIRVIWKRL